MEDDHQNWTPRIEWTRFNQGPISEKMWACFKEIVKLSCSYRSWRRTAKSSQQTLLRGGILPREKNEQVRKQQTAELDKSMRESHVTASKLAYLIVEKMAQMSSIISGEDEGTADWVLWQALSLAMDYEPNLKRAARYDVAAFGEFDAESELSSSDPQQIANRWLAKGK